MNYCNDKDILTGCLSGHNDALEAFIRRFSDPVYRTIQYTFKARNVPFSKEDIEDLHNTVFLRLFEKGCKKLRQYQGKNGCSVYSWIRMITVRTVIDYLRKNNADALSHNRATLSGQVLDLLRSDQPEPWLALDMDEKLNLVQKEMKDMSPRDRYFLKLHIYEDMSIPEVAEIMHITEANAHTIKHRAILRLKSKILTKLK